MMSGGKDDGIRPIIESVAQYVFGHWWGVLTNLTSY